MHTDPYMQDVQYVVAWQEELLGGVGYERADLSEDRRSLPDRESVRLWTDQILAWHTRQAELCLEAGPECELLFPA